MASSVIRINDDYFWAGDSVLLIIIFYLSNIISTKLHFNCIPKEEIDFLNNYKEKIDIFLIPLNIGAIDFHFDNLLENDKRISLFLCMMTEINLFIGDNEIIKNEKLYDIVNDDKYPTLQSPNVSLWNVRKTILDITNLVKNSQRYKKLQIGF